MALRIDAMGGKIRYTAPKNNTLAAPTVEVMDWEPSPRVARARPYRTTWQQKLFEEGRCFNCFVKDHKSADCRNARGAIPERFRHLTREPARADAASAAPTRVRAAVVWDDESKVAKRTGEAEESLLLDF